MKRQWGYLVGRGGSEADTRADTQMLTGCCWRAWGAPFHSHPFSEWGCSPHSHIAVRARQAPGKMTARFQHCSHGLLGSREEVTPCSVEP